MKNLATIIVCLSFAANVLSADLRRSSHDQWQPLYKWKYKIMSYKSNSMRIAISHDNSQIALASLLNVCIYHVTNGRLVHTLPAGCVSIMAFSPDGSRLATSSAYSNVHLWDVGSRKRILLLSAAGESIKTIQFSRHASRIAITTTCSIYIVDNKKHYHYKKRFRCLQKFGGLNEHKPPLTLALSNDFSKIAKAIWEQKTVDVINTKKNTPFFTLNHTGSYINSSISAQFSDDDSKIATHSPMEGYLRIWNARDGSLIQKIDTGIDRWSEGRFMCHGTWLNAKKWLISPNFSKILFSRGTGEPSQIYDVQTNLLYPLTTKDHDTDAFSPDSSLLATIRRKLPQNDSRDKPLQIVCSIWHNPTPRLAFASVLHQRLGAESPARVLPRELVAHICSFA